MLVLASCNRQIPYEEGTIDIHFCPGCRGTFLNLINESWNISCAFYDMDDKPLEELLDKKNGLVTIFEKNHHYNFYPVKSEGLMHNKYCILDEEITITGSLNPTENGFFKNKNNIVIINSSLVAKNYLDNFNSLIYNNKAKYLHIINLSGIIVENYFCPQDRCEKEVLEELEDSETSIYFMLFTITSDKIGDLLVEKSENIKVKGVIESFQKNVIGGEYWKIKNFTTIYNSEGVLHHKVFIIDNQTVITGSYNPTKSANERNDENILIIHDEDIALRYVEEFENIYKNHYR